MKTKILVRFDDICPTMDFAQFKRATDLLDKYNVRPLLGVIPDCQDPDLMIEPPHEDFWDYIKELQKKGYTIAMHGYQHVFCCNHKGIVNNRVGSEFSGVPLKEQIEKLKKGKAILEAHGVHTDIFFAPAHSYDWNTLKALSVCGFKYMSDGKSKKPYIKDGITCIPCRSNGCPAIGRNSYYTAVFHAHEWARKDKEYDYRAFCNLLEKYHEDVVSFKDYAERQKGNTFIQRLDEELYLKWLFSIRPIISKFYHKLRKLR